MGVSYNGRINITGRVVAQKLNLAPIADFSAIPLTGTASLSVDFTDLSTNNPTSWAWDFQNNGSTDSTLQNPTFAYTSAGTYSVKLTATNASGDDTIIKNSYITVDAPPTGQQLFTTLGTQSFIVPAGVTSISVVTVGGGGGGHTTNTPTTYASGGGGGSTSYVNNLVVTPGETLTVVVGDGGNGVQGGSVAGTGGISRVHRSGTNLVAANGGAGGASQNGGAGGTVLVGTGGTGGRGGDGQGVYSAPGGGGGAGGYSSTGGRGGQRLNSDINATAGSGGGGGGGQFSLAGNFSGGGGGIGVLGTGTNGTAGTGFSGAAGGGGSSGGAGGAGGSGIGGSYGGGAGTRFNAAPAKGGQGAVRIIWGSGRSFPSNAA